MSEVVSKVSTNLKDRFNALTKVPETAKNTLMGTKDELMNLRPGKAATHLLKKLGDGTIEFVDEQLDITRRWI